MDTEVLTFPAYYFPVQCGQDFAVVLGGFYLPVDAGASDYHELVSFACELLYVCVLYAALPGHLEPALPLGQSCNMNIFLLLLTALLSYGVAADDTLCVNAITTAVTPFKFADASSYYVDVCAGSMTSLSVWAAAKTYCTPLEAEAGIRSLNVTCLQHGGMELTSYDDTQGNFTDEFMKSLKVVEYEDIAEAKLWNETILISKPLFETSERTVVCSHDPHLSPRVY